MKEKELNTYDSKEYMLKTYFIINNRKLFSTDNFNFEDNLKNCFYIKSLVQMFTQIYIWTQKLIING